MRGEDGRYHILKVIGPDEFHEHADDNAYHQPHGAVGAASRPGDRRVAAQAPPGPLAELAGRIGFDEAELAYVGRSRGRAGR